MTPSLFALLASEPSLRTTQIDLCSKIKQSEDFFYTHLFFPQSGTSSDSTNRTKRKKTSQQQQKNVFYFLSLNSLSD